MEYLKEKYWKKINSNNAFYKGVQFENLIKTILENKYGVGCWQQTKGSWDGNKDFYWYNETEAMWAECKNYSNSIGLKIVSASLIMAQIYEINTLIFFSYTEINNNTKSKIVKYADKINLKVIFYDDVALEKLIFEHWDCVNKNFFDKYHKSIQWYKTSPIIDIKVYKNPLSYEAEETTIINEINLFHMFEIDICIINRNNEAEKFTVSLEPKDSAHLVYFEIEPNILKSDGINEIVNPFESKLIKIFYTPCKSGENIVLPTININCNEYSLDKKVETKINKCHITREKRLIGESYGALLKEFETKILANTNRLSGLCVYGNSGTGKSKIYEECIKKGIINNYIVLNYSSVYEGHKNYNISKELIKDIIVSVYDLASEEVLELLDKIKDTNNIHFNDEIETAYKMLKLILVANTEKEYCEFIDKYGDIIFEKLRKKKYLIAIDNVQFYDNSVAYLLKRLLDIANNSNEKTALVLLLTFNLDYIKMDSMISNLLLSLNEQGTNLVSKKITGFQNKKECTEYLQETLSLSKDFSNVEIDKMIDRIGMNPFFINQMVNYLYEEKVLYQKDNYYYIQDRIRLNELLNNIPSSVFSIIERRWKFFLDSNKITDAISIISAIHFWGGISRKDIKMLGLSESAISELHQKGFIHIDIMSTRQKITFEHDLIHKYYMQEYFPLSKNICHYINENRNGKTISLYGFRANLFNLILNQDINHQLIKSSIELETNDKISHEYYSILLERCVECKCNYNKSGEWLIDIINLFEKIRDYLGSESMIDKVSEIVKIIHQDEELCTSIEFAHFLMVISESLDAVGKYAEAIDLLNSYLVTTENTKIDNVNYNYILAKIYNRLHVYRRHQCINPLLDKQTKDYIDKSLLISEENNIHEMLYVNYSDKGYLYYALLRDEEESQNTKKIWELACDTFEENRIPQKTLNYYRKKVQLSLLNMDSKNAIDFCSKGLDYVDNGKYSYQTLLFKWWFNMGMVESYIQAFDSKDEILINYFLNRAYEYDYLFKSQKKFCLLQLNAIYLYYLGKKDDALKLNSEAYKELERSKYNSKRIQAMQQIKHNEKIMQGQNEHSPSSQIYTIDGLFNLPCI